MEPGEFLFGAAADASQVSAVLSARYAVHVEPGEAQQVTFVDTADWRLYDRGLCLCDARRAGTARAGRMRLTERATVLATAPSPAGAWPRLVSALPQSPVRERIASTVGIRALLPLAEVGERSLHFRLLDDERKTRVHVQVDQQRLVGSRPAPLPLRVLVSPLRGYERDARRAADILTESLPPGPEGLDGATAAVRAAGLNPGESPVAPLDLGPDDAAIASTTAALRRWLEVALVARAGVLDDVDSEFLHELRAALRATRALLHLNADVLPAESTARFAAEFAWLGQVTGPLRDLDVALLEIAGQGGVDVSGLDLDAVRDTLIRRRRTVLRDVRAALRSSRAVSLDTQWRSTLERWSQTPLSGLDTADLAARHAVDAYDEVIAAGADVHPDSSPGELHRLRRRCKRMRYLLDTFVSVYEPGAHEYVRRRVVELQDCLGGIQDVAAQRAQLAQVADHLGARGAATHALLAIGALRERLLVSDREARRVLDKRLGRLRATRTRDQVLALRPPVAAP